MGVRVDQAQMVSALCLILLLCILLQAQNSPEFTSSDLAKEELLLIEARNSEIPLDQLDTKLMQNVEEQYPKLSAYAVRDTVILNIQGEAGRKDRENGLTKRLSDLHLETIEAAHHPVLQVYPTAYILYPAHTQLPEAGDAYRIYMQKEKTAEILFRIDPLLAAGYTLSPGEILRQAREIFSTGIFAGYFEGQFQSLPLFLSREKPRRSKYHNIRFYNPSGCSVPLTHIGGIQEASSEEERINVPGEADMKLAELYCSGHGDIKTYALAEDSMAALLQKQEGARLIPSPRIVAAAVRCRRYATGFALLFGISVLCGLLRNPLTLIWLLILETAPLFFLKQIEIESLFSSLAFLPLLPLYYHKHLHGHRKHIYCICMLLSIALYRSPDPSPLFFYRLTVIPLAAAIARENISRKGIQKGLLIASAATVFCILTALLVSPLCSLSTVPGWRCIHSPASQPPPDKLISREHARWKSIEQAPGILPPGSYTIFLPPGEADNVSTSPFPRRTYIKIPRITLKTGLIGTGSEEARLISDFLFYYGRSFPIHQELRIEFSSERPLEQQKLLGRGGPRCLGGLVKIENSKELGYLHVSTTSIKREAP